MPSFSRLSRDRLHTCADPLQLICNKAITLLDFSVICGHRGEIEQNRAFASGNSQLKYPHSKHNSAPSQAVDLLPYPTGWRDTRQFHVLAGIIFAIADANDIKIRWGGDFNKNWDLDDDSFRDLAHYELI